MMDPRHHSTSLSNSSFGAFVISGGALREIEEVRTAAGSVNTWNLARGSSIEASISTSAAGFHCVRSLGSPALMVGTVCQPSNESSEGA